MALNLDMEFIVSAKPEKVMQLLTDPVLLRKWSGEDAIVEKETGGRFEMFGGWVKGEILKTGKDELAYTWKTEEWDADAKPSQVHYKLAAHPEGTKVILHHEGLPDEDELKDHKESWEDQFFGLMEEYVLSTGFK